MTGALDAMQAIQRHRTAIPRDRLSTPMRALVASGLLGHASTVLDYGCGQGDDVRALANSGVDVVGWDPHFRPDGAKRVSHAVNLGFVLNVIESPAERREVLRTAYDLAERVLAVAVMLNGKGDISAATPHGDGFVTRRGTFQKYFEQGELRALLENTLGVEPVAVAPGLFFVFRDDELEQRYLFDRRRRRLKPAMPVPVRSLRPASPVATETFAEQHAEIVDALAATILEIGREPYLDELEPDLTARLMAENLSLRRLLSSARHLCDQALLEQVRAGRADEVTLHYALDVISRRTPFGKLPATLRRDVRAHFLKHDGAVDAATALAFRLGDTKQLARAAGDAVDAGIGYLENGDLFLLRSELTNLQPILRLYVGLAERLAGSFDEAQIIKAHLSTGKVTALAYDGFETTPLPRLRRRIKVDLRQQMVRVFDYAGPNDVHLLYMKGRYLPAGRTDTDRQRAFDKAMLATNLFDFSGHGPRLREFAQTLKQAGYRIEGFRLLRRE